MSEILKKLFVRKRDIDDIRIPAHLTRAERKQVREIVKKARKNDGIPKTAQQSIPFERMFQDGICRVTRGYYTKTIQFQDINYQLATQEDKSAIFDEWCGFLNFFDSSVKFELSFLNMSTDEEDFEKSIMIPPKNDGFNSVRAEYSQMLKRQLSQGNNGLTKTKYLTFSDDDIELLTLYVMEGFNQTEIAVMLNISQQAVAKRIAKIKVKFGV